MSRIGHYHTHSDARLALGSNSTYKQHSRRGCQDEQHRRTAIISHAAGTKSIRKRISDDEQLDGGALVKYFGAVALQTGTMTGALWVLQQASVALGEAAGEDAPRALVGLFFLVVSLRSRIFSPLDASRPTIKGEKSAIMDMRRPSWMPPPLTFPVVWSLIALLRTISSLIIWETSGNTTLVVPLVFMMLHLSVGDCWNYINNQEKRLGVAVPGVFACWFSCIAVVVAYYQADQTAGLILAPSAVWLGVATALITSIWTLNNNYKGQRAALLPTKGESRAVAAAAAAAASN